MEVHRPGPESLERESLERELLERLRGGEAEAFEQLVRTHSREMLAVARGYLKSDDAARDAVQDAFVNAIRGLPGFRGGSRLSTWLHRIVVNTALSKLRYAAVRNAERSLEELRAQVGEHDPGAESARSHWDPEHACAERQVVARVRACLDRLPEAHRRVLELREIEGIEVSEVARRLGLSCQAVKSRQYRARRALRELLAASLPAELRVGSRLAR